MRDHLVQDVLGVLQGLLGKVSLSLDLDVQTGRYVRYQDVYQLAHPEHHVLEYDDKRELKGQNLPVNGSEEAELISESSVVTFRLKYIFQLMLQPGERYCKLWPE